MSESETVHPPSFQRGEIGDAKLSAALRTLELTVKRKLDGVLQGNHLGLIPGPGSEPGESRMYQPGDDVRRMDWSVTARTTHPHVRQMIADRELETWLVVDMSASLDFGTAGVREARPGGGCRRGHHLPQQRRRQPHRRHHRQRRTGRAGAGQVRPSARADAAAGHRHLAAGATGCARRPGRRHRCTAQARAASRHGGGDQRLPRSDQLDAPAARDRRPPRGAGCRGARPPRRRAARRRRRDPAGHRVRASPASSPSTNSCATTSPGPRRPTTRRWRGRCAGAERP